MDIKKIKSYEDYKNAIAKTNDEFSLQEQLSKELMKAYDDVKTSQIKRLCEQHDIDVEVAKDPKKLYKLGYALSSFYHEGTGKEYIALAKIEGSTIIEEKIVFENFIKIKQAE